MGQENSTQGGCMSCLQSGNVEPGQLNTGALLDELPADEHAAIQIQKRWKGHQARKEVKAMKSKRACKGEYLNKQYATERINNQMKIHEHLDEHHEEVETLPELNEKTKAVLKEIGDFDLKKHQAEGAIPLEIAKKIARNPTKGPVMLCKCDNVVYEGQWWDKKRDGLGKQVWNDGSCYNGTWVEG